MQLKKVGNTIVITLPKEKHIEDDACSICEEKQIGKFYNYNIDETMFEVIKIFNGVTNKICHGCNASIKGQDKKIYDELFKKFAGFSFHNHGIKREYEKEDIYHEKAQNEYDNLENLEEIIACNFAIKLLDRQMKRKIK